MESEAATAERRSARSSHPRAGKRAPQRESGRESKRAPKRASRIGDAEDAARRAAASLGRLIDHPAEGSSEVSRGEEGNWRVCVDVVELRRVPDTMSLMATYEVDLGQDGDLLGYRRVRRYHRGTADT
jgi:hypothetical protein